MSLEVVKNIARIPLNVVLMVVLLPVLLIEYVIGGLTMLATLLSLLQCDDIATGFKFITAYQTGALLKTKFPNSIAVRSQSLQSERSFIDCTHITSILSKTPHSAVSCLCEMLIPLYIFTQFHCLIVTTKAFFLYVKCPVQLTVLVMSVF